jgi:hypothetical protein
MGRHIQAFKLNLTYTVIQGDVRRLRLNLEPWRKTQAVKELDEQLALAG